MNQEVKADSGKARLSLVPTNNIYAIAGIETYDQEAEALVVPKLLYKTRKQGTCWKAMFECPFCGKHFEAFISNITRKKQKSCGCMKGRLNVASRGTHGDTNTRLYRVYRHILERCNVPSCHEYKWYGARGIKCEFGTYEEFRDYALSHGYRDDLTCERIDVNGNYAPGNVTFIPLKLQARNTRSNVRITYKGLTLCASEWAEIMGVKPDTITMRKRKGWSDERTIETPVGNSLKMEYVPVEIIEAIRNVRLFGIVKYKDPDNWKKVEPERYRDAMMRHMCAYIEDPDGVDEESGMPHLWHLATNVAFLCALEGKESEK